VSIIGSQPWRIGALVPEWARDPRVVTTARFTVAGVIAFAVFSVVLLLDRANPITAVWEMFQSALGGEFGRSEVLVKLVPIGLCAAATAVPARAGLINVGGEGQFHIGALFAGGLVLYSGAPDLLLLPLAVIGGAAGGALWAGLAGGLRVRFNLNEAISTLLLNYVAIQLVNYFVFGPWRDPDAFNWPFTADFPSAAIPPGFWAGRVHAGLILVPIVLGVLFFVFRYTRAGYEMRAVGGNALAAARTGIPTGRYLFWSLVAGGAIAGLAGMAEVTAIQGRLRPGISIGYGFIGFLASWLGGHRPVGVLFAAALFSVLVVGGDSLQISAGLPGSSVNILMALMLFALLAGRRNTAAVRS